MKITTDSHLDHGLSEAQIQYIKDLFGKREEFFRESFKLPAELGTVPCGLNGPKMGDEPVPESEVLYESRNGRPCDSRLCGRPLRQTSTVTVIAGPHESEPCILYTAFGGPLAPQEPGDPNLAEENKKESVNFWAVHALSR